MITSSARISSLQCTCTGVGVLAGTAVGFPGVTAVGLDNTRAAVGMMTGSEIKGK